MFLKLAELNVLFVPLNAASKGFTDDIGEYVNSKVPSGWDDDTAVHISHDAIAGCSCCPCLDSSTKYSPITRDTCTCWQGRRVQDGTCSGVLAAHTVHGNDLQSCISRDGFSY